MSYVCYIGVFSVKQCHQIGGLKSTVEWSECCTASCFELNRLFLKMENYESTDFISDKLPEFFCFMTCNGFS